MYHRMMHIDEEIDKSILIRENTYTYGYINNSHASFYSFTLQGTSAILPLFLTSDKLAPTSLQLGQFARR